MAGRVCRAWLAGSCESGDRCEFSHALAGRGRETIGERARAAAAESSSRSSSSSRSWADMSEDSFPELDDAPAGGAVSVFQLPARPAGPEGGERQLPNFNDRLDFPEYVLRTGAPEPGEKKSRSALRRKKRELADRRTEYRELDGGRADSAAAAASALDPRSVARPPQHLDFPRSEADSPPRSPAPWPTPRLEDRPKVQEHRSGLALLGSSSTKVSL